METKLNYSEEVITPEKANEYLIECNKNNRIINWSRVNTYAEQIKKGNWKLNGECIIFDSNNILVNGQHRLLGIVKSEVPVSCSIIRNVEPDAFSTIDQGYNRTHASNFKHEKVANANTVASVVKKNLVLTHAYSNVISSGGRMYSVIDTLEEYFKHAEVYQDFSLYAMKCSSKQRLFSACPLGAIMAYLHLHLGHEVNFIKEFFAILHDNSDKDFYPCKILRERIIKTALTKTQMNPTYLFNLLVTAWNLWVKGNNSKKLTSTDTELLKFE